MLADFLDASQELYRKAVWDEQSVRVEVWIEKDALAGVVYEVTDPWNVLLMVTRGFPSETFVYEALEAIKEENKPKHVYYLGDYDPSGGAIATGLAAKMCGWTSPVTLEHKAVRREQIATMGLQKTVVGTRQVWDWLKKMPCTSSRCSTGLCGCV